MAVDSGKPNRRLASHYRDQMAKRGYAAKILISTILGQGPLVPHKEQIERGVDYSNVTVSLIDEIRPKLASPFRNLPEPDLAAAGIFLIARKPR
jgi:hypothetical protein